MLTNLLYQHTLFRFSLTQRVSTDPDEEASPFTYLYHFSFTFFNPDISLERGGKLYTATPLHHPSPPPQSTTLTNGSSMVSQTRDIYDEAGALYCNHIFYCLYSNNLPTHCIQRALSVY
jgi:hypothetical protein